MCHVVQQLLVVYTEYFGQGSRACVGRVIIAKLMNRLNAIRIGAIRVSELRCAAATLLCSS